ECPFIRSDFFIKNNFVFQWVSSRGFLIKKIKKVALSYLLSFSNFLIRLSLFSRYIKINFIISSSSSTCFSSYSLVFISSQSSSIRCLYFYIFFFINYIRLNYFNHILFQFHYNIVCIFLFVLLT